MSVTIKDVAAKANVSIATVSRCFNQTGYISDDARTAVSKAAQELGFKPKKYHQHCIPESTADVIGVIITEYNNPFFEAITSSVERVAHRFGKSVIVCSSQESATCEMRYMELLRSRVGGLLIAPASQVAYNNSEYLKTLNESVMPVVLLDRESSVPQFDGVYVDSFHGTYDAIQMLIGHGHRNIAIVAGPTTSKPGLDRLNGYLEALKDNSIPIREEYILYGEFVEDLAYSLTTKLLTTQKDVTAIFSSNINMSFGCIKAIYDQKLHIPEDISYLGFDDFPMFDMSPFKLSVINNPGDQLGEEAAMRLINRMENYRHSKNAPVRRIILMPQLLLRGSEKYPSKKLAESQNSTK